MSRNTGVIHGGPKQVHFYHLDACDEADYDGEFSIPSIHFQRWKVMRSLVRKHIPCEYHDVKFSKGAKKTDPIDYFKQELKSKGPDDLVMVYYHGKAGNAGEDYQLRFAGYPQKDVNGYQLVKAFADSGIDCILLLDCQIPNRLPKKWRTKGTATVEIIARGDELHSSDGKAVKDDVGDFTHNLCIGIDQLIVNIDLPAKENGFKGWTKPTSFPGIMRGRKDIAFNPRRVWLRRTRAGDERYLARIKIDPEHIRETGKLHFFMSQIQGGASPESVKRTHNMMVAESDKEEPTSEDDDSDDGADSAIFV